MHMASAADRGLVDEFEAGSLDPALFDHRAHVKIAYVYLTQHDAEQAAESMKRGLIAFLAANDLPASKFHETLTRAWILAVQHFMQSTGPRSSADDFIDSNAVLLDPKIMLTHYSADLLFSPRARAAFVPPDIDPIPEP